MLVLVDTSVWVDHFRNALPAMANLLTTGDVVTHSVVLGELAVGNLRNRQQTLDDLRFLLAAVENPPDQILAFVEAHRLFGVGLSWGDVQLLAAAQLNDIPLGITEHRLHQHALALQLSFSP